MVKITTAIGAVVHSSELCPMRFQGQKSNILTLSWVIILKVPPSWNYDSGYDSKSICASFKMSPPILWMTYCMELMQLKMYARACTDTLPLPLSIIKNATDEMQTNVKEILHLCTVCCFLQHHKKKRWKYRTQQARESEL